MPAPPMTPPQGPRPADGIGAKLHERLAEAGAAVVRVIEEDGARDDVVGLGHVLEQPDGVPAERLRVRHLDEALEGLEVLEPDVARQDALLVGVWLDAGIRGQGKPGRERVDRDQRQADVDALRPGAAVELPDVVPGLGHPDTQLLEKVGPVRARVPGRVDREPPEVAVPLVARMARADRVGGLIGYEGGVQVLVERDERPGGHDLADVRVVVHEHVVALREVGDRGVGEALERAHIPFHAHARVGLDSESRWPAAGRLPAHGPR